MFIVLTFYNIMIQVVVFYNKSSFMMWIYRDDRIECMESRIIYYVSYKEFTFIIHRGDAFVCYYYYYHLI